MKCFVIALVACMAVAAFADSDEAATETNTCNAMCTMGGNNRMKVDCNTCTCTAANTVRTAACTLMQCPEDRRGCGTHSAGDEWMVGTCTKCCCDNQNRKVCSKTTADCEEPTTQAAGHH